MESAVEEAREEAADEIERLRTEASETRRQFGLSLQDKCELKRRLAEAVRLLNRWKVAAETGAGDLSLYADTCHFLASQEDKP